MIMLLERIYNSANRSSLESFFRSPSVRVSAGPAGGRTDRSEWSPASRAELSNTPTRAVAGGIALGRRAVTLIFRGWAPCDSGQDAFIVGGLELASIQHVTEEQLPAEHAHRPFGDHFGGLGLAWIPPLRRVRIVDRLRLAAYTALLRSASNRLLLNPPWNTSSLRIRTTSWTLVAVMISLPSGR